MRQRAGWEKEGNWGWKSWMSTREFFVILEYELLLGETSKLTETETVSPQKQVVVLKTKLCRIIKSLKGTMSC